MLCDEDVGMAIAINIHQTKVGVAPIDIGRGRQRLENVPVRIFRSFEEASNGALEDDAIQLPVTRKIEKLMAWSFRFGKPGKLRNLAKRLEARGHTGLPVFEREAQRAQIPLVVPGIVVLGENALQSLAVEIEPLVSRAPKV
jgi:hypothetical protein